MPLFDVGSWPWPWPILAIYAIGTLYGLGFILFFFLIERSAQRASSGDPIEVARHNRILRRFPTALYARMLGRRPLSGNPPARRTRR